MFARRLALTVALGLLAAPAFAEEPAPKTRKMTEAEAKALEKKVIAAVNAKAGQIDACVNRHLKEFPSANGKVSLSMSVDPKTGRVTTSDAKTSLKGARNLRPCIAKAGRGMAFPPPNTAEPAKLGFDVFVKQGAKFKLYAKGEAPKAKPGEPQPEGIMRFTASAWTPGWKK